jgi:2-C-methyl-D-erythritol 2,4-cyclodiphosphate synthase
MANAAIAGLSSGFLSRHMANPSSRIGIGTDIHRLQAGGRLMLGGVCVSEEMSAIAHSDGDVVLHALVDAIFGALGLGDIGEHFSNSDPRWQDADSTIFVQEAMKCLHDRAGSIINVDVTIQAEKPSLKPFKPTIRATLQALTRCPNVNVKAGTNEGCDAVGRGEAIAATVVVLVTLDL